MNIDPHTLSAIEQLLLADIQHGEELVVLLQAEKKALESRDSEQLQTLLARKKQTLSAIEDNTLQRQKIASALSSQHPELDTTVLLTQHFQQLYNQYKNKFERCEHLNNVNGKIIKHSQGRIQRMLRIFSQNDEPMLYNSHGLNASSSSSGRVTRA